MLVVMKRNVKLMLEYVHFVTVVVYIYLDEKSRYVLHSFRKIQTSNSLLYIMITIKIYIHSITLDLEISSVIQFYNL